ncbi:MAG: carboxypeptidase-like regulatory domain-containing protein, partial [Flammeovirgaceae bacterium]
VGQNARVTGKITDGKTNEPVPFANIYFDGTSIGTSSDSLGQFQINNIPVEYSELVVSCIGFKTMSTKLSLIPDRTTVIEFKMIADATVLSSIVIRDKRDKKWEKLYKNFLANFIGQTSNSKLTRIINPEVLDLKFNPTTQLLTASASEPLELENLALGYRITLVLEKFEASADYYSIHTKSFFQPISPKNKLEALRWQKNRVTTFEGSQRHFFQSIIRNKFKQHGFSVKMNATNSHLEINEFMEDERNDAYGRELKRQDLLVDSTAGNFRALKRGIYKVVYRRNDDELHNEPILTSWIEVNDPDLKLQSSGMVLPPANFWQLGYFETLRLADQLPSDYNYWEEEKKLFRISNSGAGKVFGWVRDENGNPLKNVTIFIDNGLTETKSNHLGQFEFARLPSGEYPFVFAYPGKQTQLKVTAVDSTTVAEVEVIMNGRKVDLGGYTPITKKMVLKVLKSINPKYSKIGLSLQNPENLFFKNEGKAFEILADKPLVFVSNELGYEWNCFFDKLLIDKNEIKGNIYFKLDTLRPLNEKQKNRWVLNRRRLYTGTWNQFLGSLLDGKLLENHIEVFYDLNAESIKVKNTNPITVDSLVQLKDGKLLLTLKKKSIAQFRQASSSRKVKWLILDPHISEIQISKSGVYDPNKLTITSVESGKLPLMPIDQLMIMPGRKINIHPLIEKIYLQTDKAYYYPGDTIWFKGYLKYGQGLASDLKSKVLYVDLLDNTGIIVAKLKLPIKNARANGDLFLPENTLPGNYTLRAYTRYSSAANHHFLRPIPVLALAESIESIENDSSTIHTDLSVNLISNKETYRLGDTIRFILNVLENGRPAFAEGSVAVTDQLSVGALGNKTIAELNEDVSALYKNSILDLQPEQGLTHKIKVISGDPSEVYTISALAGKGVDAISTTIKGKMGSFILNFHDSSTVFLKCINSKNKEFEVAFVDQEFPVTLLSEPLEYKVKKGIPPRSNFIEIANDSVALLDEVLVKAKRTSTQKKNIYSSPSGTFLGNEYEVMNDQDLINLRKSGRLWEELYLRIPRLRSRFHQFSFWLNGRPVMDEETFLSINTTEISRIEIYKHPENAIVLYTESMIPFREKNHNLFKLRGFSRSHQFYGGNSEYNNFRSTVYWSPTVTVAAGSGSFEFPTSKSAGSYKVVIEGITDTEKTFRIVKYITIQE